ncbi:hypothetical protein PCANC_15285 [Puccinia coronata f. sp. avenae]|uniref:Uncharacterized protein n=1 Tax=Puccinia coronata f. sp. avenae TaxID=200324 RepID=A0A2N5UIJ3_9BASI|nr:hypothetical protein PCANC_15285 [Puccinia coronata f. sp. avenae]
MDYIYLALKITVENENFVTVAYDIFRYKATKLSDSEAMKMHISPPRDAYTAQLDSISCSYPKAADLNSSRGYWNY